MNLPRASATLLLFHILLGCLASAAPPDPHFKKSPRFHDPSTPIRQGDSWIVFSTGNGISTRHSRDLNKYGRS